MNDNSKIEYGDFQTPSVLAQEVSRLLQSRGLKPASVIEPTCGHGAFIFSALDTFRSIQTISAFDISETHLASLRIALDKRNESRVVITKADFFHTEWNKVFHKLPKPILVLGNPPWVTSAALGSIESGNSPKKTNFNKLRGIDAITGKSNFDIAEWMLLRLIGTLSQESGALAMLCKTSVARKILKYCWKNGIHTTKPAMWIIDAKHHFNAATDACLFVCEYGGAKSNYECPVYLSLDSRFPGSTIGFRDGMLISDVVLYERHYYLRGSSGTKWRSGVKHDCSKVMELYPSSNGYKNGYGEEFQLEEEFLYPMLKSSELTNGVVPTRRMIVTQRRVGADTGIIAEKAKKTWQYLLDHSVQLDARASVIYKNKPRFSIFGVGEYTFANYKVAISGFYKKLEFKLVPPFNNKPVILDDTAYFLSFDSYNEAKSVADALNSQIANEFYQAYIFWDSKRPITIDCLKLLDIRKLIAAVYDAESVSLNT